MTTAVLTPFTDKPTEKVGRRLFRKQILPRGRGVMYQGRRLDFTDDYLTAIKRAFDEGAMDSVKFFLADTDNRHTSDPERMRGTVRALELVDDGIDVIVEASNRAAAKLLTEHPDLGVSARLVEGLEKSDGRAFSVAVEHVLGTPNPRVTGLRQWEAVTADLNSTSDVTSTLDLSGEAYTPPKGDGAMPDLKDELREKIAALPDDQRAALLGDLGVTATTETTAATTTATAETDDGNVDGLSDEEFAALVADVEAAANQKETADLAGTVGEQAKRIDLAMAMNEENRLKTDDLESRLAASKWGEERSALMGKGVPKFALDLAEPVLKLRAGVIDLADGSPDVVGTIRKLVEGYAGIVDLSVLGSVEETTELASARETAGQFREQFEGATPARKDG